jgi:hypothetical protein
LAQLAFALGVLGRRQGLRVRFTRGRPHVERRHRVEQDMRDLGGGRVFSQRAHAAAHGLEETLQFAVQIGLALGKSREERRPAVIEVAFVKRLQCRIERLARASRLLADGAAHVLLEVCKAVGGVRAHLLQAQWTVRARRRREGDARLLAELARFPPQAPPRVRADTTDGQPGELARRELDRLLTGNGLARPAAQRLHRPGLHARSRVAELTRERPGLRRVLTRRVSVRANAAGGR